MIVGIITDAHLFHKNAITPQMYKDIIQNKMRDADIIVDCGDLTDKSNLTARQLDDLADIFKDLDKPMYFVAGNHDSLDNTTVASILRLNPHAFIITKPCILNDMLFIPYTDDKPGLLRELKELFRDSGRQCQLGFSHLNITHNPYATFRMNDKADTQKLSVYCMHLYNGHIHEPEFGNNLYGEIINPGACSSLTFGDKHIPQYTMLSVNPEIDQSGGKSDCMVHPIMSSIIHMVLGLDDQVKAVDCFRDTLRVAKDCDLHVRFRVDLPNNPDSLEVRKAIKEQWGEKEGVSCITFSYVSDKSTKAQVLEDKQKEKLSNKSLTEQLIEQFEKTCQVKLLDSIKEELMS